MNDVDAVGKLESMYSGESDGLMYASEVEKFAGIVEPSGNMISESLLEFVGNCVPYC